MKHLSLRNIGVFLSAIILFSGVSFFDRWIGVSMESFSRIVLAEEEDEDEEEEDEDDSKKKTTTKQEVVYETRFINDPPFLVDTDKDGLVDGVDPEPKSDFREYFTDKDGDGVPNAFDRYHDEDDFSYHDREGDENNNGISDSYE